MTSQAAQLRRMGERISAHLSAHCQTISSTTAADKTNQICNLQPFFKACTTLCILITPGMAIEFRSRKEERQKTALAAIWKRTPISSSSVGTLFSGLAGRSVVPSEWMDSLHSSITLHHLMMLRGHWHETQVMQAETPRVPQRTICTSLLFVSSQPQMLANFDQASAKFL